MQKQVAKVRSGLVVRGRVAAKGRALDAGQNFRGIKKQGSSRICTFI
jgi:hypothetical protein